MAFERQMLRGKRIASLEEATKPNSTCFMGNWITFSLTRPGGGGWRQPLSLFIQPKKGENG